MTYDLHEAQDAFEVYLDPCFLSNFYECCLLKCLSEVDSSAREPPTAAIAFFNGEVLLEVGTLLEGVPDDGDGEAGHLGRLPALAYDVLRYSFHF